MVTVYNCLLQDISAENKKDVYEKDLAAKINATLFHLGLTTCKSNMAYICWNEGLVLDFKTGQSALCRLLPSKHETSVAGLLVNYVDSIFWLCTAEMAHYFDFSSWTG